MILPSEERRTIEYTDDSVLLIVKSDLISVTIGWRLLHFLTNEASQSMTNQLSNEMDRIGRFNSK